MVLRYSLVLTLVGLIAAFWSVAQFVPADVNREFWLGMSLLVMFIVAVTWLPETYRIFRDNKTDGPSLLILAVSMISWVLLESRALASLNYYLGRPDWIYNSSYPAFIAFQVACVGVLILVAVAKQQSVAGIPESYWRRLLIAGAIGLFMAGATFGFAVGLFAS